MRASILPLLAASVLGGLISVLLMWFLFRQSPPESVEQAEVAVDAPVENPQEVASSRADETVQPETPAPQTVSARTLDDSPARLSHVSGSLDNEPTESKPQSELPVDSEPLAAQVMREERPAVRQEISEDTTKEPSQSSTPPPGTITPTSKQPTQRVSVRLPIQLPPPTEEIEDISSSNFLTLRKEIRMQRLAVDALAMHKAFMGNYTFNDRQQKIVDEELEEWKAAAEENKMRLGVSWVSESELHEAEEKSKSLIEEAEAMIALQRYHEAVDLLGQASSANPSGIRADYEAGLIQCLPAAGVGGLNEAEKLFKKVLTRDPNHAAALNSLGILLIKNGEFNQALNQFTASAEQTGEFPEVIQNVGRFVDLAINQRIVTNERSAQRFGYVYQEMTKVQSDEHDPKQGWLHTPPIFTESERFYESEPVATTSASRFNKDRAKHVIHEFGTAVVVAPDYLLTDVQVVYDDIYGISDRVTIPTTDLAGNVVAVSDTGLAIIHIPDLNAPWLPLIKEPLVVEQNVGLYGYLKKMDSDKSLHEENATVRYLKDLASEELFAVELASKNLIPGGVLLSNSGEICGSMKRHDEPANQLRLAIGVEEIQRFLEETLGTIPPRVAINLPEKSVIPIFNTYRAGIPALDSRTVADMPIPIYEDATCSICNGRTKLPCPVPKCVRGQITAKGYVFKQVGVGETQVQTRSTVFQKVDCPGCVGGYVDCPKCRNGFDEVVLEGRYQYDRFRDPYANYDSFFNNTNN